MLASQLRHKLEQRKGERKRIIEEMRKVEAEIDSLRYERELLEQSKEIIRKVGIETQKGLQYHVSDITSLALNGVFNDPYELNVNFVERRGKIECELLFAKDGHVFSPLESSGYGAVDVASFALRVASWSMQNPRSRNVIILDEPFRFLSEDRQPYASQILKEVSNKLGIQFIIVTHEDVLTQYADRVFEVKLRKGVSQVNQEDYA